MPQLQAQEGGSTPKTDTVAPAKKPVKFKFRKVFKKGKKQIKAGNVYGATETYEEIMKNRPDNAKVAYQLANTYYIARDYKSASKWYQATWELEPEKYPLSQYYYGLMLKMTGNYIEAKVEFDSFSKSYRGDNASTWKRWARTEKDGCELGIMAMQEPDKIELTHLDESVNHAYSDIAPLVWDDTTLMYATLPVDTAPVFGGDSGISHYIKLYEVTMKDSTYENSRQFTQFDMEGMHVANGAFSPNRDRFYFTICNEEAVNKIICNIYVSKKVGGKWSEPESVGDEINQTLYTSTQPAIGTYNDDREVLYFVSNRPDGKGGMDLWYSIISSNGSYGKPRNCGSRLNTDRDEATPYYDNITGTLYFSSNGHENMGGYDVFKTIGKLSRWTRPEHMGYPINSQTDDMYFRYTHDQKGGYVVSNRPGVFALKSETCCDDIFSFKKIRTLDIAVDGMVFDNALPEYPLNGSTVALYLTNYKGFEEDILVNSAKIENDKKYLFDLEPGNEYKLVASKDTYLNASATFDTKNITTSDTLHFDLFLTRIIKNKTYSLRNIYYDYDKASLRDESKPTLDSLYQILTENPGISIELGAHTDARGSDDYNSKLSQARAESVVKYLIDKGIDKSRLVAKGYGESQPIEECDGVEGCSMESGSEDCPCHQKNRRTEFKIIGEKKIEVNYEDERYNDEPSDNNKRRR